MKTLFSQKSFLNLPAALCFVLLSMTASSAAENSPMPDSIRSKKLIVQGDWNYPPYEFLENGRPAGFNIDVFRAVADVMSLNAEIRLGPWSEVRNALESEKSDITYMYYSEKRSEKLLFSTPHIIVTHALFVRENSDIQSLKDVLGRKLIVQQGDIMHDYAVTNRLSDKITLAADPLDALWLLASGRHDCALLANLQGQYLIHKNRIPGLKTAGPPFEPRKYCFAVQKGNDNLLAELNEGLTILNSTGQYQKIYEKWFGIHETLIFRKKLKKIILFGGIPLVCILMLSFLWLWGLRRQVRKKTELLTQEIFERKNTENALRKSEKKYRELVQSANSIIIRLDSEGRITFANWFSINFFGHSEKEFIGKSFAETLYTDQDSDDERAEDILLKFIPDPDGSQPGAYQIDIIKNKKKDGGLVWIAWTRNLIYDDAAKAYELLCIGNDITDKKQAEEKMHHLENRLQQAQKMEAIGTLSGGIAHDFNNILSIIIGNAELAQLNHQNKPVGRYLNEILAASLRAKDIIRQLLNFCRHTAPEKQMLPIPIVPLLKDSLRMMKSLMPSSIKIQSRISSGHPVILGEASQIHQVIMNLCLNASQSMERNGGILTVQTEELMISEKMDDADLKPGPCIRLSVRDTGCGISPKIIDRIYEPYFTTKPPGQGSGIGLSVVHGIIESHEGAVTVESSPGKGTVFSVYFPLHNSEAPQTVQNEKVLPEYGSGRILFVDDEPDLAETGRQLLEQLGYDVKSADSPLKALEIFLNAPEQFDLVITDMTMPDMDGEALSRKLLSIRPSLPIIMCTGYNKYMDEEKARAAGIQVLIEKPYKISQLVLAVRQTIAPFRPAAN